MAKNWRKYLLWFAQEHVEFRVPVSINYKLSNIQVYFFAPLILGIQFIGEIV